MPFRRLFKEDKWMEKQWTVPLDGMEHRVELHWTYWGGVREVVVDGRVVARSSKLFRAHWEQSFDLDGHRALVTTKSSRRMSGRFMIDLTVDGSPVRSTSAVSRWEAAAGAW